MKKRELKYIFHNPNSMEATANHLLKVLIEMNTNKVEELIITAAKQDKNKFAGNFFAKKELFHYTLVAGWQCKYNGKV